MKSKIALVTGASKGIGLSITKQLLKEGWQVIGIARSFPEMLPEGFIPYPIDLEETKNLPKAFKELVKLYPYVDALICNAGKGYFGSLEEHSFEGIQHLMNLNFMAHVFLIKSFLPTFKRRGSGSIIMMGSEAALAGKRMGSIYCASKFALRGFTQALREECATQNIRVTLINPGMVKSSFFEELNFAPGQEPQEHILPEDIAQAVAMVLNSREGTVYDEINLSPQKKRILFKKTSE